MSVDEIAKRKAPNTSPAPALAADEGFDGRDAQNGKKKTRFNRQHDLDSAERFGGVDEQSPEELSEEDFWAGPPTAPQDPKVAAPGTGPQDPISRAELLLEEARVLSQTVGALPANPVIPDSSAGGSGG